MPARHGVFDIRDTGPGIPASDLERIFEPFVRGSTAQAGGSGVGLTIARMLTDLMGGEMQVSSTPGEGSNFRIRLFLPQVHSGRPPASCRAPIASVTLASVAAFWWSITKKLIATCCKTCSIRSAFRSNRRPAAIECLQIIPRFAPHLVFMDLAMPGIDGWETIRRIRSQSLTEAHIAILSANAFDKGLDNDAGVAAEDFIVKPLRVDELLDWIGRKLQLEWVLAETPAVAPASVQPLPLIAPRRRSSCGARRANQPRLRARHSQQTGRDRTPGSTSMANSSVSCANWRASSSSTP
jgi:CheY-like chemotaxis protein